MSDGLTDMRSQPDTEPTIFSARLSRLRAAARQSRQYVADRVGCSLPYLRELETGQIDNPGLTILAALAAHYRVTVAQLIGESEMTAREDFDALKGGQIHRQGRPSNTVAPVCNLAENLLGLSPISPAVAAITQQRQSAREDLARCRARLAMLRAQVDEAEQAAKMYEGLVADFDRIVAALEHAISKATSSGATADVPEGNA